MKIVCQLLFILLAISAAKSLTLRQKESKMTPNHFALPVAGVLPLKQVQKSMASCNETVLAKCTYDLSVTLNINVTEGAAKFLLAEIKYIMDNGLPGFEKFCGAINVYVDCIGKEYFDTCLSIENIESQGIDANDATVYATMAQQLKFECGPAFDVFVGHFQCMDATLKTSGYKIVYCIVNYNTSLYKNPTKYCEYTQEFVDCYTDIFETCGADMEAVLCESMAEGYKVGFPDCTVNCMQQSRKFPMKTVMKRKVQVRK